MKLYAETKSLKSVYLEPEVPETYFRDVCNGYVCPFEESSGLFEQSELKLCSTEDAKQELYNQYQRGH